MIYGGKENCAILYIIYGFKELESNKYHKFYVGCVTDALNI